MQWWSLTRAFGQGSLEKEALTEDNVRALVASIGLPDCIVVVYFKSDYDGVLLPITSILCCSRIRVFL